MKSFSRRNFVKTTLAASTASVFLPKTILANIGDTPQKEPSLKGKKYYMFGVDGKDMSRNNRLIYLYPG